MMSSFLPDSLQLALPPQWSTVPLETGAFDLFVSERVAELADALPRAETRQLELLLHRLRAALVSQRVSLAGTYLAFDDRGDGGATPVLATVVVTTLDRAAIGTDVPLHEDVLLAAFSTRGDGAEESQDIEPPTKVVLKDRPALRLIRLATFTDSSVRSTKMFVQTYLVPVADGDGAVVLNFSTINFEYAKQFSELFEKIAGTLRILYPDDPTFDDDVSEADGDSASPGETVD